MRSLTKYVRRCAGVSRRRRPGRLAGLGGGAAALALLVGGCGPASDEPARNFVLISLDTVRADHLGAQGYPEGTTPHLDRWLRRGAQFSNCVAQAASTLPSHRSMFRSQVASRSREAEPMLAEHLRAAGWQTVAFTGGGNLSGELGFSAGFDLWEETDRGLEWARGRLAEWWPARDPERPVFAFLHTYDVHLPYEPPGVWARRFDPEYAGTLRPGVTRPLFRTIRGLAVEEAFTGDASVSERDRRYLVSLYDAGLAHCDREFGRLLYWLDTQGRGEDTGVAIVSDHGEEFWDHGSVLHSHTVYQELIHTPLGFVLPGEREALFTGVVRNLDVAPTVLEWLGLAAPPSYEGQSLLPRIEGDVDEHAPAVSEMRNWKSFVDWPWKLIVEQGRSPRLFHLERDPGERDDVGSDLPDLVRALEASLAAAVAGEEVQELADQEMSPELEARLQALGYVE